MWDPARGWVDLGGSGDSLGGEPRLCSWPDGLVVAWREAGDFRGSVAVRTWDGTQWRSVEPPHGLNTDVQGFAVAADVTGIVAAVIQRDPSSNARLYVRVRAHR